MAGLIDEVLVNDLEASNLNDMVKTDKLEPKVEEKVETKPVEDDVPEKYRGKSLKDIVSMHQEAEKLIGRQGSEVGELRKVVDDFIKTQSKVRTELFARAETQYDYDSAKELLSTWNEKQNISKKVAETSKVDRDQQLKAADVGSQGATESVAKKKYRRSDIIKLMQSDPDKYDAMSQEIMAAYREGRVI